MVSGIFNQALRIEKLINYARVAYLALGIGILIVNFKGQVSLEVIIFVALSIGSLMILAVNREPSLTPTGWDYLAIVTDIFIITYLINVVGEHSYLGMLYLIPVSGYAMRFGKGLAMAISAFAILALMLVDFWRFGQITLTGMVWVGFSTVFFLIAWLWGEMASSSKRVIDEISQLVIIDELTGAYNMRFFRQRFCAELKLAQRKGFQVALLMVDIDHFKNYNDCQGHPAGDRLLWEFCQLIKGHIRECDILVRCGGEEFAIILPDTGGEGALKTAERIRKKIMDNPFYGRESQPDGWVSASIGIAVYPQHGQDIMTLVQNADYALYYSKRKRNQVELFKLEMQGQFQKQSTYRQLVG
ncbi:MAG: GGDEF domain-containing protein [Clostridia bacterium]|nr:GGDEF domain-containing protein [Clostridia bacterium]